ncbi:unnamed protein product [Camellia sinensis]
MNWLAGHSYFVENVILCSDSQFALFGDSEYDDDNEGNNLDFEEEEESVSSATASYSADKPSTTTHKSAEDLLKEVKQLLGPEERDILQQNVTPNLGKISTVYISDGLDQQSELYGSYSLSVDVSESESSSSFWYCFYDADGASSSMSLSPFNFRLCCRYVILIYK